MDGFTLVIEIKLLVLLVSPEDISVLRARMCNCNRVFALRAVGQMLSAQPAGPGFNNFKTF